MSILEQCIAEEEIAQENLDPSPMSIVNFFVEQLKLAQISKHGRRYSSNMLTTAFLWKLTSPALYQKLQGLFVLPSSSLLRKLSAGMNVESGKLDMD